jgi:hypothetical protein
MPSGDFNAGRCRESEKVLGGCVAEVLSNGGGLETQRYGPSSSGSGASDCLKVPPRRHLF